MDDEGVQMINPPHPGQFLRFELEEGRSLSVSAAADALHVTRQALTAMLNGRTALTADMALRFEKAFSFKMETLMRMQHAYDIAQARQRAGDIDVPPYVPKEPQPISPALLRAISS